VKHQDRLQSSRGRVDILVKSSPYIQLPVRPRGDTPEIVLFAQQLECLLADPDTRPAWAAFWLIAQKAYDAPAVYKGYLLGLDRRPAGPVTIAKWIYGTPAETRKTLAILERTGLIERVECPDFDAAPRPKSRRHDWRKQARKKTKKKAAKKTGKKDSAAVPHGAASPRGTLSRNERLNTATTASGKTAREATRKRTATAKVKAKTANENAEALKLHADGKVIEVELDSTTDRPVAPTSAPPMPTTPTCADGPDARPGPASPRDPGVRPPDLPTPRPSIERMERIYDPQAKAFAAEVYAALRTPHAPHTPAAARELANFAAAWSDAQVSGMTVGELDRLWRKSVAEAKKLGKARRRKTWRKSPEAVWRWVFGQRLEGRDPSKKASAAAM